MAGRYALLGITVRVVYFIRLKNCMDPWPILSLIWVGGYQRNYATGGGMGPLYQPPSFQPQTPLK
jgi:hypothetical protein